MLRAACVVLLLAALPGCAQATTTVTRAASTEPGLLGACRALTPADIDRSSNESAAVDCDDSLVLRSTVTWTWFRSSNQAWDDGAHTWPCDVVGGGEQSRTFVSLPGTAKDLPHGRPDDRRLVCADGPTVSESVKIPCSRPHVSRAVTTLLAAESAVRRAICWARTPQ